MTSLVSAVQFGQLIKGILRNDAAGMLFKVGFVGFRKSLSMGVLGKLVADLIKFFRTLAGLVKDQRVTAVFAKTLEGIFPVKSVLYGSRRADSIIQRIEFKNAQQIHRRCLRSL